ncbi:hypothetical protein LGH70_03075 [Hymenobacter sp. BT635]|uniref:Uncharacterized protein n=1 Tax=Hymenobacter nitidus TaxID=2880929 RepID=A0ABS8A816_9BACT|nr:hypothetical protein [Hymenobacter nitidus]MCB2376547.1 hypothetical protein [Hymenobacter nitidus]
MSIALVLLTLLFPSRPIFSAALPSTVAHLSPRTVAFVSAPLVPKRLPRRLPTYTVTATIYEPDPRQTDSEPFITADNSRIRRKHSSKDRWMALSRDLLKKWGGDFDYGDSVLVTGISPKLDGVYVIHDTMNRRHRHCMDILAAKWEHLDEMWKGVKIMKVEPRWRAS